MSGSRPSTPSGCAAPRETSHFVTIATDGHGAPAAPMGPRGVAEEKSAREIRACAQLGIRALDHNFRGRPGDCGKKPIGAALAGHEIQPPRGASLDQLVVPLGTAEYFVDGRS